MMMSSVLSFQKMVHPSPLAARAATIRCIQWRCRCRCIWTRMVSSFGSSRSFSDKADDEDRPFYIAKYPPEKILKRLKEVEDLLLHPDCENFGF